MRDAISHDARGRSIYTVGLQWGLNYMYFRAELCSGYPESAGEAYPYSQPPSYDCTGAMQLSRCVPDLFSPFPRYSTPTQPIVSSTATSSPFISTEPPTPATRNLVVYLRELTATAEANMEPIVPDLWGSSQRNSNGSARHVSFVYGYQIVGFVYAPEKPHGKEM